MNPSPLAQKIRCLALAAIVVSAVLQGTAIARGASDPLARAADRLERQLARTAGHERDNRDESFAPLSRGALRQVAQRGPDALIEHACNSLEQRLLADAADGRLDRHTLLDAALIASGVECEDELRRYRHQREALLRDFHSSPRMASVGTRDTTLASSHPTDPQHLAVELFDFMHQHVLDGGYRLECTDLRDALDRGRYNCVSSSVLFKSLGESLGLTIVALEMPGHALVRLQLRNGRAVDVETTCPEWFHLKDRPEQRRRRLREQLGETAVGDRSAAREVSPMDLAAMIYYNRGVSLLAERRFAEAAIANAKALHLDPRNTIARGNLLATLNNWAIALGESSRFAAAVEVIEAGVAIDPDFETFAQNYVHVHHQWAERLVAEGRYEEAIDHLRRATAVMPDRRYLRQTLGEIERRRAAQQHGFRGT